jgi:hypothetical protein
MVIGVRRLAKYNEGHLVTIDRLRGDVALVSRVDGDPFTWCRPDGGLPNFGKGRIAVRIDDLTVPDEDADPLNLPSPRLSPLKPRVYRTAKAEVRYLDPMRPAVDLIEAWLEQELGPTKGGPR